MIEILQRTGEGTCRHCHGRIVHHVGDLGTDEWTHPPTEDVGRFSLSCPGAPLADPLPVFPCSRQDTPHAGHEHYGVPASEPGEFREVHWCEGVPA